MSRFAITMLVVFMSSCHASGPIMNTDGTSYFSGLDVSILRIDETLRDAYLDHGYNPPMAANEASVAESRAAHESEWYEMFDRVKKAISDRWVQGVGDGDFFMPSDPESTRLLCIEVSNEAMVNADVISAVRKVVADYPVHYSVDICDSWFYLKTKDGEAYPHFNIFVEKDRILIYSESESLLAKLGLKQAGVK